MTDQRFYRLLKIYLGGIILYFGGSALIFTLAGCKNNEEVNKKVVTPISICARHPATINVYGPFYGDVITLELKGGSDCTVMTLKAWHTDDVQVSVIRIIQTSGTKLDEIDVMVGGRRKQAEPIFLKDDQFRFRVVTTTPNSPPLFQIEQP